MKHFLGALPHSQKGTNKDRQDMFHVLCIVYVVSDGFLFPSGKAGPNIFCTRRVFSQGLDHWIRWTFNPATNLHVFSGQSKSNGPDSPPAEFAGDANQAVNLGMRGLAHGRAQIPSRQQSRGVRRVPSSFPLSGYSSMQQYVNAFFYW